MAILIIRKKNDLGVQRTAPTCIIKIGYKATAAAAFTESLAYERPSQTAKGLQ
jgi:hypothetical protein